MGCPPGITSPGEDFRPLATPSSDNPLSGKLFLVDILQGCHIRIIFHLTLLPIFLPFYQIAYVGGNRDTQGDPTYPNSVATISMTLVGFDLLGSGA